MVQQTQTNMLGQNLKAQPWPSKLQAGKILMKVAKEFIQLVVVLKVHGRQIPLNGITTTLKTYLATNGSKQKAQQEQYNGHQKKRLLLEPYQMHMIHQKLMRQ